MRWSSVWQRSCSQRSPPRHPGARRVRSNARWRVRPSARTRCSPQMTREEKIAVAAGNAAGVPRLGIPPQVFGDGPNGVGHGLAGVTAFPNAQVVAATWDPKLAERFGDALGAETAGKGINVIAAPTVNIVRTPLFGRAAETFGEDPYLSGQIAAAEIRGMQRQRVVAQVKHFAANNQEIGRFGNPLGNPPLSPAVDVVVSERALQEIYFPAFKASVQQGGAASVMCSYPRINGTYACREPLPPGHAEGRLGIPRASSGPMRRSPCATRSRRRTRGPTTSSSAGSACHPRRRCSRCRPSASTTASAGT